MCVYCSRMNKKSPLAKHLETAIKREHDAMRRAEKAAAESKRNIIHFEKSLEIALEREPSPVEHKAVYSPLNEILALLKSKEEGCTIQQILDHLTKNHGNAKINPRSIRATMSGLKSDRKGPARICGKKFVSGEIRWFIAPMKQHDPFARQTNLANSDADKGYERSEEEKRRNIKSEQRAERLREILSRSRWKTGIIGDNE